METLYRKYRPEKFGEMTGQEHIREVLEGELRSGRIAHAYLFSGPRGVGKTTAARLLAKAVNCLKRKDGSAEPCGKCGHCEQIVKGSALDVIEMDAATHTQVDTVRENIVANARVTPASCKYKVFIIDEVHMLSTSSFNALLKTLEEPPPHAIFILATTELHKVPDTIASRCQRFEFRRVGFDELVLRLKKICAAEGVKISLDVLGRIARIAEGCPRDAESMLGQIMVLGESEVSDEQANLVLPRSYRGEVRSFILKLAARDAAGAVRLLGELAGNGIDFAAFSKETIEVLREEMLLKLAGDGTLSLAGAEQEEEASDSFSIQRISKIIERLSRARAELDRSEIEQLPLELAAVDLCLTPEPVSVNI